VTFDATSGRFYDDPWATYRWLRDNEPVYWDEANGLWVISRHEDVSLISRSPERYCSRFGVRPRNNVPLSILTLDDPEHTRQRRLINRGFTPAHVRRLAPHIEEVTDRVIAEIEHRDEIDFVNDVAVHVPLIVIAELIGLDPDAREQLHKWSDAMVSGEGREDPDDPLAKSAAVAFGEYVEHLLPLVEERRANPRDDLISVLTTAYDEGALDPGEAAALHRLDQLDSGELLMFLVALVVAGNETTRNAIAGGLLAFSRFPEQKQKLLDDPGLIDLAVEEVCRYVSPVLNFTRTVTEDHELHGRHLGAGDRVLMLYQSANRDERVFDAPDEFRIDRDPNPHLAFGIGPHYCLGANLAKLEIKTVFSRLFARVGAIRAIDAPLRRAESALVLGIERLPARVR